jgi:hypothetical protein
VASPVGAGVDTKPLEALRNVDGPISSHFCSATDGEVVGVIHPRMKLASQQLRE